jgi:hypothetical protein
LQSQWNTEQRAGSAETERMTKKSNRNADTERLGLTYRPAVGKQSIRGLSLIERWAVLII